MIMIQEEKKEWLVHVPESDEERLRELKEEAQLGGDPLITVAPNLYKALMSPEKAEFMKRKYAGFANLALNDSIPDPRIKPTLPD